MISPISSGNGGIGSHLDSYQHCPQNYPEHEALNVSDPFENAARNLQGRYEYDRNADINNSFVSVVGLQQRKRGKALIILLVVALCLVIGWFASNVLSPGRHRPAATDDSTQQPPGIPDLIWSDEFDGDSVDSTKWTFVNGNGCDVGLCGWGNNELEWYTPSNAHVSDGELTIEARKFVTPGSPSTYTSAKIVSRGKADFGVAGASVNDRIKSSKALTRSRRFESRLKLPWGNGIWPAFWMLPTYDTYGGWPKSGEIDIMENIGKEGPNTVHGTVHYGLDWPQHQYSESGITLSTPKTASPSNISSYGNLNETFHTYSVERLPGVIRWYIDDIEYSSITNENMKPYHWSFDEEFYFIFNLAVGGNWPGSPLEENSTDGDATVFPQRLVVDYVRVYEGIFPRVSGNSLVGCSEKNVVYEVVNVDDTSNIDFNWTIPNHAVIKEGQGTSRIIVDFDFTMMENNIIDNQIIHVQADGLDDRAISMGLMKLRENGIGSRVKIVDFDGKCLSPNKMNATMLKEFNFDCGRPSDCNQFVLQRTTDEFTCGERIEWLMNEEGMDEMEACKEVGYVQFHGHCGQCNPLV